jgi:hypothetical protein
MIAFVRQSGIEPEFSFSAALRLLSRAGFPLSQNLLIN